VNQVWLIYDSECPFCTAYVRRARLKKNVELRLVDARSNDPLVETVVEMGLDLNEGMVLKSGSDFYHGADCIHVLALMSSRSGLFNKVNALIFASPTLARILYPILRAGRNLTLRLLGRERIAHVLD